MAFATASFVEVLDDLSSRFIINVPEEELASVERICFQHWADEHEKAYGDFLTYKFRVPVCGAIILNETLDKCLLVKGWTSKAGWGFPRGKINKDESYASCAAREVFEETGFDLAPLINEEIYLERTIREQHIRLFIIPGIPETTQFNPQTRKEISLVELPTYRVKRDAGQNGGAPSAAAAHGINSNNNRNRFYMVIPFVNDLRRWIERRRQNGAGTSAPASRRGSLACNANSHAEGDGARGPDGERAHNGKNRQGGHGKKEHRRTRSKYQHDQGHATPQTEQHPQQPIHSSTALLDYLNKTPGASPKANPVNTLLQLAASSDAGSMHGQPQYGTQQTVSPALLPMQHTPVNSDASGNPSGDGTALHGATPAKDTASSSAALALLDILRPK
ncbi:hypothetical protein SYNPS1DRAFT_22958 [Syncephalis pseudoplumigaleata]|uniref:Nudix hydrolase domain-containing protein n=1 Tax=Syncephalis pseudoplumigaleata TaxID=1712513 RepID=A0A4P9YYL2_9FUNG|nr:hypothetical protein SYNPS1DRAFT_22958 [Syncephalis pseudoplumigaleata]|eukprot:RKP25015.1 hypothetical protein SYNPS1DRAFT_22958 [Syncephalis pseudoplumigaleata]